MAIDLLKDMQNAVDAGEDPVMPYCIRFDYESLLFVSIFCAVKIRPEDSSGADETTADVHLRKWE